MEEVDILGPGAWEWYVTEWFLHSLTRGGSWDLRSIGVNWSRVGFLLSDQGREFGLQEHGSKLGKGWFPSYSHQWWELGLKDYMNKLAMSVFF